MENDSLSAEFFNTRIAAVADIERRLQTWMKEDTACKAIAAIPGVELLTATATIATRGDAKAFRSGREFAAWLGQVPKQIRL
ncbi:transposase [Paraburkholderia caledonica]|uniref:Transposase n=1 Tax=Paraburkholderia caledonica TaxID=134536 RepID=A0AB73IM52_9BURK|nr:transposase [Paraburkholderia caledonica]